MLDYDHSNESMVTKLWGASYRSYRHFFRSGGKRNLFSLASCFTSCFVLLMKIVDLPENVNQYLSFFLRLNLEPSVSSDDAVNPEPLFSSVGGGCYVPRSQSLGNGETDVDANWAEQ